MNKSIATAIVLIAAYATLAQAEPIQVRGNDAMNIMNALRMARVNLMDKGATYTFEVRNLSCVLHSNNAVDENELLFSVPTYGCNLPNARTEAQAKVVIEAISALVPSDSGMGQTHFEAKRITCKVEAPLVERDKRFTCEIEL